MDKASRCLYDFTSILYLSTNGEDFQGGRFRFLDDDRGKELVLLVMFLFLIAMATATSDW